VSQELESGTELLRVERITKRFPSIVANDQINLEVKVGEVQCLLGENGAGKTTLMNILYGLYQPDEGDIYLYGRKVSLKSPHDAINLGIGMVHQRFMLFPPLKVVHNIIIGLKSRSIFLDVDHASRRITELSNKYCIKVDPQAVVSQLSMGERQRVEIVKALYRNANLLILDEPTSVLTPQEVQELFVVIRSLTKQGKSVIFITHKLNEVISISDRVTVLRDGRVVSTLDTSGTNEKELARMMVGRELLEEPKRKSQKGKVILDIKKISAMNDKGRISLRDVFLSVYSGEILGLAGIAGNGQKELAEVITGLRHAFQGKVYINGRDLTNDPPSKIIEQGVGYIPEDKVVNASLLDFSISDNLILKTHTTPPFSRRWLLNRREIDQYADKLISQYDVRPPNKDLPVGHLSGGNLNRLIFARELSRDPCLLIAATPTSGLDVAATKYIHRSLLEQRDTGTAILLISEDLNEVLSLSDRIAVIHAGKIMGIVSAAEVDLDKIGLMMAGAKSHLKPAKSMERL